MFSIGFWEVLVVLTVALVVLGPGELATVGRFAGRMYARATRLVSEIRNDWHQASR